MEIDHEMTEEESLLYRIYTVGLMLTFINDEVAQKKAERQIAQWERKLKQLQKKGK